MRTLIRRSRPQRWPWPWAPPTSTAQAPGNGNFQWYVGGQGGVTFFKTPTQGRTGIPTFGGHTLIVAKRTGLMLSVDEAVGSERDQLLHRRQAACRAVTFNDIRRYSAVLMAFPIRAAAQPYLGVGYGIIHVVNPTAGQLRRLPERRERARAPPASARFVGGLQFQVGRFMAFGQYQITSGRVRQRDRQRRDRQRRGSAGCSTGPTHTFTGGLRIGLGSARDDVRAGGY